MYIQYSLIDASLGKVLPFTSFLTAVGIPPTLVARLGTPKELASQKTWPKDSARDGIMNR
jgi:hypothetical protein